MFVDNSMTRQVITIRPETGMLEARSLMDANRIRHLPVVDADDRLVGIVSDRDIRSAMPSLVLEDFDSAEVRARLEKVTAADIMTRNPDTVTPVHTIQDALLLITEKKVGAFPVVDAEGKLKGLLSVRDLIRAFINVLGIREPGTLLGVLADEKVGEMKRIVDAITEENISIGSVLVARHWEAGKRAVFPYLLTNNVGRTKRKLKEMGYPLIDPMEWYIDQLPQKD
ncbi:MAG: CBS domain-containing protein [Desulfococcaceae bacterium]